MRYALLIRMSCWLLSGYVLACGSPPRTAEQEVAFQDSIAAIRTHREFQAMQAVEAERAGRDSIRRESKRVAARRGRAAGRAVRAEHERWRRCVVAITKDSTSTASRTWRPPPPTRCGQSVGTPGETTAN